MVRRKKKGRFAMLPRNVLRCETVANLDHLPYRLLTVAAAEYNGHNNGDISLAESIVEPYGIKRGRLSAAIQTLLARGLLIKTRQGGLGRCSLYALPWFKLTDEPKLLEKFDRPLPRLPDMSFRSWAKESERLHPQNANPASS